MDQTAALGFIERRVDVPSHICLFYYDDTELRERLPFLRIGLETTDEVVVLFGPGQRLRQVLDYLAEDFGRDVASDLAAGKIVLIEGAPTGDEVLGKIATALDAVLARGARLIRFFGFIGWQDPEWPAHDDLLAFESQVNVAVTKYPVVTVCTYRLTDIPGPLLIYGGIQTHRLTIIGHTICENPHFLGPGEERHDVPWLDPGRASFAGVRVSRRTDAS